MLLKFHEERIDFRPVKRLKTKEKGKIVSHVSATTARSFFLSTKSDLTSPAYELTWYIVEVTGWGAYEAGWLEIRIAFVIARCVTSWQSSVEPAHCGVTGWHIRRAPRCRTVQQTPCNDKEKKMLSCEMQVIL